MTSETEQDAVCVCGHPRHEHNHVDDLTACGHFMDDDSLCECNSFLPASPSPAHDVPAAQLRERIARLEAENERLRGDIFKVSEVLDVACIERTTPDGQEIISIDKRVKNMFDQLSALGVAYTSLAKERDTARAMMDELRQAYAEGAADAQRAERAAQALTVPMFAETESELVP